MRTQKIDSFTTKGEKVANNTNKQKHSIGGDNNTDFLRMKYSEERSYDSVETKTFTAEYDEKERVSNSSNNTFFLRLQTHF